MENEHGFMSIEVRNRKIDVLLGNEDDPVTNIGKIKRLITRDRSEFTSPLEKLELELLHESGNVNAMKSIQNRRDAMEVNRYVLDLLYKRFGVDPQRRTVEVRAGHEEFIRLTVKNYSPRGVGFIENTIYLPSENQHSLVVLGTSRGFDRITTGYPPYDSLVEPVTFIFGVEVHQLFDDEIATEYLD